MGRLVLDDLGCAHLPEWRAFRMVLTWFAGGVGPLLQHRDIAVRALDARRGEARLVGRQNLHAVDETVAKIITKREPASVDDVAMLVSHLGVAFRVDALAGAVVGYAVGLKHSALIEQLNRTHGRDRVLVLVVDKLIRV